VVPCLSRWRENRASRDGRGEPRAAPSPLSDEIPTFALAVNFSQTVRVPLSVGNVDDALSERWAWPGRSQTLVNNSRDACPFEDPPRPSPAVRHRSYSIRVVARPARPRWMWLQAARGAFRELVRSKKPRELDERGVGRGPRGSQRF
jgi:hypothetical protein